MSTQHNEKPRKARQKEKKAMQAKTLPYTSSYRALVQLDDLAVGAGGLEGLLGAHAERAVE